MPLSNKSLPELLAPAGSPRALDAAIDAGADAVYFGASSFNARIGAENFSVDALGEAIKKCHAWGVRSYITLNTLTLDREISDYLGTAEMLLRLGADAFITADLGGAALIKKYFPEASLHASTQMSGHNTDAARLLSELGFSRMVLARETSFENICSFTKNAPIEAEIFIHGALCVSHSGQCLFSSIVGGRSGNRGECAQPCRLPYAGREQYPLSLRDLSLASHIPAIIESGVASLKIEGRMKSAEYVHGVVKTYRALLDEKRPATADEISYLSALFSRNGFTDGYFTERISHSLLGIRSEGDKERSRALEPFDKIKRKLPISLEARFEAGKETELTLTRGERSVKVTGDIPLDAINAPLTEERALSNLSKLGDTPFILDRHDISVVGNIMIPASKLNDLRRRAVDALIGSPLREISPAQYKKAPRVPMIGRSRSARFLSEGQITETARKYFDIIYLPLSAYSEKANGVIIPPVVFDSERSEVLEKLREAKKTGAEFALVGNLGHLALAREAGLIPMGDFRLNVFNSESGRQIEKLGFSSFIVSPELTLPQIRDIGGKSAAIVYGRIPLMLLEKCAIKEIASCEKCADGNVLLKDRKGICFPIMREYPHRNVIYNSLPTYMGDRKSDLKKNEITNMHFIFSTESAAEVDRIISAFESGEAPAENVRRIKS